MFALRVQVTINRFYDDKYHGRIATGSETGVLSRKTIFHPWILESGQLGVMDIGESIAGWFPIRPGKTYQANSHFCVSVSRL